MKNSIQKSNAFSLRSLMMISMLFLMILPVSAQMRNISGLVVDQNGEPIIGANVVVNNDKTRGTITDIDGKFVLQASSKEKLKISYIGFIDKFVLANKSDLKIILKEDTKTLDEVVVVGYGTQKKATLTGAVSAVTNKEMVVTKNENVVNMLSGKVPGVRITQTSSAPGDFANKIDIRGMGEPLIVVDGIPRDQQYFSRMDANEIESVSVLKDASAAIYGVRAANGVILVTSKHGSTNKGKVDVTLSANFGWQNFLYMPNVSDAAEYMTLINEKNLFGNINGNYFNRQQPKYSDELIQEYLTGKKQSTNWADEIFAKSAPQQQYNVSMNGGSDKINYFFNIGYMNQEGQLKSRDLNYDRWNFRANIDAQITKRLKATVQLSGYMDEKNEPQQELWTFYKFAWIYRPTAPAYINGDHSKPAYSSEFFEPTNPAASQYSDLTGRNTRKNYNFNGSAALTYDIPGVKGLNIKAFYSYDYNNVDYTYSTKKYNLYGENGEVYPRNTQPSIKRATEPKTGTVLQLSANYNNNFNGHGVGGMFLYEEQHSEWDNFYAQRLLKMNGDYLIYGELDGQTGGMTNYLGDYTRESFIGKFNYDYKGRYMVDFSFRVDASSKFPSESRWGFFPSVSAGWRISEEKFIKENAPFISNLKLRASYGKMGDDSGANNYPMNSMAYILNPEQVGYFFNNGAGYIPGVQPTAVPNPNLTWYTAKTVNVGLDFDLWNQKLSGTFEFFNRHRDGLLATSIVAVPGIIGAEMPQENLNSDRTYGWEFSLGHRSHVREFNYWINAQISGTKNRWDTFTATPAGNSFEQWRRASASGRNKDIWFAYEEGGRFQNWDQIRNHNTIGANINSGTLPGDYWYEDWNGDGVVNANDEHPYATFNLPVINYGFNLGGEWRGLDLSLNFQGAAMVYNEYNEAFDQVGPFGGQNTLHRYVDRWHMADPMADPWHPDTKWIEGEYPATGHFFNNGSTGISNSSYLRLKTLELGYTLPKTWSAKMGVESFRLYFNGYNLLTFCGMDEIDPERPGRRGGANDGDAISIMLYNYPVNRTFNIGATIKF